MADNKQETGPLEKFLAKIREFKGREIIYRGQSDADWEVESTAYRRLKMHDKQWHKATIANKLFKYSKDRIDKARPDAIREFGDSMKSDLRLLAKLRHHGAATIFVDFTKSAFTALWFACQENKDKDGKVFCLDVGAPTRFSEINPEDEEKNLSGILDALKRSVDELAKGYPNKIAKYEPPRDDRVLKQDSFFIFNAEGKIEDGEFGKFIITIKKRDKDEILEQLKKLHNLSEEAILPDFYGFAQNNDFRKPYYMQTAEDLNEVALIHQRRGDYEGAIKLYGDAIESDSAFVPAYNNRGNAKAMLRRYEEALADFDEALKREPNLVHAYINRGNAKFALRRYKDAIKDHNEALKRDSNFASAYNNRGNAKFALKRYEGALADFDRAIKLEPNSAPIYSNRARAKFALKLYEDAIEDFDKLIDSSYRSPELYYGRGVAKLETALYDEALEDFDRAEFSGFGSAELYFHRGSVKYNLARYDEAIVDLDKAIKRNSEYAEAYYGRGLAKRALGLDDEAQKDFKKAHELAPDEFNLDDDGNFV